MKTLTKVCFGLFLAVVIGCSNPAHTSSTQSTQHRTDSIAFQQMADSVLESIKWNNPNSHIKYLRLNGHVTSIEYSICGDAVSLPFKTINFDDNGNIIGAFSEDLIWRSFSDDPKDKIVRLGVEGSGLSMEFNYFSENNKSIFSSGDEAGELKYIFSRDSLNEITECCIQSKFYPDMTSDECEQDVQIFKVKINTYDSYKNWTSMSLYSNGNKTTVSREIKYIEEPSLLKFINSDTTKRILCKFPTGLSSFHLRSYDCKSHRWNTLLPPDYEEEMFGYKDFRLIGDNLYLIYNTGNNFANSVLAIYQYNITQYSWQMLDTGGEGCEFIGDKIKVQKYEYDDYYNHNEEWKDIISWIELR